MKDPDPTEDEGRGARIPSAVPGCDLRRLPLSPTEAYVLSRVDGSLSEAELIVCTGLDALVVTVAVDRLASLGALRFSGSVTKRPTSQIQPRADSAIGGRASGSEPAGAAGGRRSDIALKSMAAPARAGSPSRRPTPPPTARPESQPRGLNAAPAPGTSAIPGTKPSPSTRVTLVSSAYRPASARPGDLDHVKRYLEAARVALAEGNSLGATNFYRLALGLAPNDRAIQTAIEESVAITNESRAMGERAGVFVRRGDAAARERRWKDAVTDYEEAARLAPRDAAVLYKVAGALYRSDALRPAAEFAQRAVTLAPARVDSWLLLAQVHLAAGSIAPARQALAEAQKLSPHDERIARLRANLPG